MTKFNVGDRVVAMRSKVDVTEGRTYEVVGYPAYGDREVYIRDDVGERNAIYVEHLELAEDYEDESVKQLRMEIDALKSEMDGLEAQVTSLVVEKSEPKPTFNEGDRVRFKTDYIDFEGDGAIAGEGGEVISCVYNPVVMLDSDLAKVLIDTNEVEVSDVLEHVEDSASSNENETKERKTIVVEYDPIEWSEVQAGDVILCNENVTEDVTKGRLYSVNRVFNNQWEIYDDLGEVSYVGNIDSEDVIFLPLRQRITG